MLKTHPNRKNRALRVLAFFLVLVFAVPTIAAPGDLDTTFNSTGFATTTVTASADEADAVAVQSDGKIVVAGYSSNRTGFALVRYTSSGALDTTFGTGGIVTTTPFTLAEIKSIAILADGKIVVGGYIRDTGLYKEFAIARYTSAGALDTTFGGGDGITTTSIILNSEINAIAIQSDGKIIAAGGAGSFSLTDFAVARYTSNGILDTSFNSPTGYVTTDFLGGVEIGTAVRLQTNGKIVVAGSSSSANRVHLARYETNGSLDTTFGVDGKVSSTIATTVQAMAIQSDGKIVVGGFGNEYCLARYTSAGSLDTTTFGTNGVVFTTVGASGLLRALTFDSSGKILVTGFTIFGKNDQDVFLSRHLTNGNLDPIFDGGDGIVTTSLGTNGDRSYAITTQSDGKIVLAGSLLDTSFDFAVLRYQGVAPTAAPATLGGRITRPDGYGIPGVSVVLSGPSLGQPLSAITSSLGYYNFYNIPTGQAYIITPDTGRYTFTPEYRFLDFTAEFLEADFTSVE